MNAPLDRSRRLIRAPDLAAFRTALAGLATGDDPSVLRRRVMILPTRASIELFRQTLERAAARDGRTAFVLPHLVTRDGWLTRLHEALAAAPPLLTRMERERLFERAAVRAAARPRMGAHPFVLRPGLLAAMLDFYDELRLRLRDVRRFARVLFKELKVERGMDRGSESLVQQTSLLAFAFLGYERAVAASGAWDEHLLRAHLIGTQPMLAIDHVVVAVADHPADPRGLWPADFDLLGRLAAVRQLDVVVTDEAHDAGFRERLEQELPGIADVRLQGTPNPRVIVRPAGEDSPLYFVSRDREEELRDVARAIRARAAASGGRLDRSTAIVFQRPLPYLYLAQQVLAAARIPFQAFDALPLAVDPAAALLDLVLDVARTGGTRESLVALLRSPLLRFVVDDAEAGRLDVAALDAALAGRRSTGDAASYADEVSRFFGDRPARDGHEAWRAMRAARAGLTAAQALAPYRDGASASSQIAAVSSFLRRYERVDDDERRRRSRAAVLGVLDGLADACLRHGDAPRPHEELTALIRHWIEAHTFTPHHGQGGIHLVDAVAARFGTFDHVHLVGLVDTDWPERSTRSIFYTSGLLSSLGWPQESEHMRVQHAAFRDLVGLPAKTLHLHAFQLEGDGIVALSPLLEVVRGLDAHEVTAAPPALVFDDEVLTLSPPVTDGRSPDIDDWLAARQARPPLDDVRYRGRIDPRPPKPYRVSKVDRYADCPFKFFSEDVLGLPEERDEESGLTPLERGTLVHTLFEQFYREWQRLHPGTITADRVPAAVDLFGQLARQALAPLPEADRVLEETRLFGSIVGRGLAERVFELEADEGGTITDRLLEMDVRGSFAFPFRHGLMEKTIEIRGKADRIDVFDDGSIRVVDYKLGRLPDTDVAVQIAVYAYCVQRALEAQDGRPHPVHSAMYLAFGDDLRLEAALGSGSEPVAIAVESRAAAFAGMVDAIEQGHFGAQPRRPGDCQWCRYAGVCRKEYVTDDDAAEPV